MQVNPGMQVILGQSLVLLLDAGDIVKDDVGCCYLCWDGRLCK